MIASWKRQIQIISHGAVISDDRENALEYFDEICGMTDEEKTYFGIESEE